MYEAYLNAYLGRVKRMPDVKKFLSPEAVKSFKKKMTAEQMLEKVKQLNALFGGKVVEGVKKVDSR